MQAAISYGEQTETRRVKTTGIYRRYFPSDIYHFITGPVRNADKVVELNYCYAFFVRLDKSPVKVLTRVEISSSHKCTVENKISYQSPTF